MNKTDRVRMYCIANPDAETPDIISAIGCSGRTARRGKKDAGVFGSVKRPRILLLDIETSFLELGAWGIFKPYVTTQNILKEWAILSWSAKWLFEPEIISQVVSPHEAIYRKDASIIQGIWDLIEEADIVIAHNAVRFDDRKLKARFIANGLGPTMPYRIVDTLKASQKEFAFSSHKLDFLNGLFEVSRKKKTDYDLWKRCVARNEISSNTKGNIVSVKYNVSDNRAALEYMEEYNRSDITALEELYLVLLPWIKSHPPLGLYTDGKKSVCPTCGSGKENFTWKGFYYTPMGRYKSFRCEKCEHVGRIRTSDMKPEERQNLVISTAR